MNLKEDFGRHLKAIRNIKGVTQEKLAELIGIEQRQLSRIETGKSFISFGTFEKVCMTLDITPAEFFNFGIGEDIEFKSELKNIISRIYKIKNSKNKIKFLKLALDALENDKKALLKLQAMIDSMLILLEE